MQLTVFPRLALRACRSALTHNNQLFGFQQNVKLIAEQFPKRDQFENLMT